MTHFSDPSVIEQDLTVLKNFWHTTNGLYIWEFLTTLGFEVDIIRGRRPYRWTIWIYSLTRMSTLMAIILNFLALDMTAPINCQIWITSELFFGYLSLIAASLLIVLRVIAIWNHNKLVIGIAIIVWVTNVSVIIQGKFLSQAPLFIDGQEFHTNVTLYYQLRSVWDPVLRGCIVLNTEDNKPNIIVALVTDIVLLLVVLIGLFRLLRDSGGSFDLGRFLWKQGVVWLLIATVAEVTPTVFIILNLNGSFNLMFQLPSEIAMSIAATRMYRGLTNFVNTHTDIAFEGHQKNEYNVSRTKSNPSVPIPLDRIEVTADNPCERHPAAQMIISVDGELDSKTHESRHNSDLERALENRAPG